MPRSLDPSTIAGLRTDSRWKRIVIVSWLAVVGLVGGAAAGEPDTSVVLVGPAGDPILQRVEQELGLLDIATRKATAEGQSPTGADAVVVVERDGVSIRFADEHGGDVLEVASPPGERPEVVALATVELVRGRLLEVPAAAGARPESAAELPVADAPRVEAERHDGSPQRAAHRGDEPRRAEKRGGADANSVRPWGLFVGSELLLGGSGLAAIPGALVGLDRHDRRFWYVAAKAHLPLRSEQITVEGGAVDRKLWAADIVAGYGVRLGHPSVRLDCGAGIGLLRVRLGGEPDATAFSGESAISVAAWPRLELAPVWYFHSWLALRGLASLGLVVPPAGTELTFVGPSASANKDVAETEVRSPVGFLGVGLELRR